MIFKKYKNKRGGKRFLIAALFTLFLDQTVKLVIARNIFFEANIYKNADALFGIPLDSKSIFILYIIFFAVLFWERKKILISDNKIMTISLGLMSGGIASNFIDRMVYGYILDYINLPGLFSFNIADLAIFFGALTLGCEILRK